jgi:regulator of extracellular matrix RemA (YlzA/DUF370 family)
MLTLTVAVAVTEGERLTLSVTEAETVGETLVVTDDEAESDIDIDMLTLTVAVIEGERLKLSVTEAETVGETLVVNDDVADSETLGFGVVTAVSEADGLLLAEREAPTAELSLAVTELEADTDDSREGVPVLEDESVHVTEGDVQSELVDEVEVDGLEASLEAGEADSCIEGEVDGDSEIDWVSVAEAETERLEDPVSPSSFRLAS